MHFQWSTKTQHSGLKYLLNFVLFSPILAVPLLETHPASKSISVSEENTLADGGVATGVQGKSNIPGEPLTPDEFIKGAQLIKTKGAIDPNDPTNEDIEQSKTSNKEGRQKDVVEQWDGGRIPYVLDSDFDEDERLDLAKAIQQFEDETCIRFVAADLEKDDDYVFIENSDEGCKSPIGHKGGRQSIKLANQCFDQFGRLLHELLHTVGFVHEQSRSDRDKYVLVDYDVIKEEYEHNFEKRDPPAGNYAGAYDTNSVLHYSAQAFAEPKHEITIFPYFDEPENLGQRDGFSKKDVEKVNKWYKCKPKSQSPPKVKSLRKITCSENSKCTNLHNSCSDWAKLDHCTGKNSKWMTVNCRLACNKCEDTCQDLNEKCSDWAQDGFCDEYDDFMVPYCSASCKTILSNTL